MQSAALVNDTRGTDMLAPTRLNAEFQRRRSPWVDYARGMAIVLVVYRHSMVGLNRAGTKVPDFLYAIQEFVFNFRMPVFFILSGIFLAKTIHKYKLHDLIRKKTSTLLYPYLLWTAILITIQIIFSKYTNSERTTRDYLYIITQPRNLDHMWYLLALFNTSTLFVFLHRWLHDKVAMHVSIAVILHFSCFLIKDYSLFSDLFYNYIFIVIGVLISKSLLGLEERKASFFVKAALLILPFFIAGQLWWLNTQPETFILSISYLAIILIACAFFYAFCRSLQSLGFALWLSQVGKNSLYIYILHILVISSFRIISVHVLDITNIYFLIGGSLVLGIVLPILLFKLTSKLGIHYIFSFEKPTTTKQHG